MHSQLVFRVLPILRAYPSSAQSRAIAQRCPPTLLVNHFEEATTTTTTTVAKMSDSGKMGERSGEGRGGANVERTRGQANESALKHRSPHTQRAQLFTFISTQEGLRARKLPTFPVLWHLMWRAAVHVCGCVGVLLIICR